MNTIRCRLDRVCADIDALALFPTAHAKHIEYPGSDHLPIRLELEREIQGGAARRSRPYGFEAVWIRKHECEVRMAV